MQNIDHYPRSELQYITYLQKCKLVETYFTPCRPAVNPIALFYIALTFFLNCVFVPCAQRVALDSATTTDDALWRPAAGTASASQDGEGPGVTWPWKLSAPMARTMKEVRLFA